MTAAERGRRLQAAAQSMVDWYAAAYGPRRARRYLGACARHGLRLPADPGQGRSRWLLAGGVALLLLVVVTCGLGDVAGKLALPGAERTEVAHERR